MTFDALAALRGSGQWVDLLSAEQKQVLAQLSRAEVEVLVRLKRRLDEAAPDVQGQELKVL
ncbi:aroma-sacti cluster domain-containing protein [Nonomuraea sediminis]|uniref:aroma-sacti cluster domain-containing protein n=1 Tax=Nonomuraea sediminis TaxID=2835864 RepID=UPI001BDD1D8A|nr:aroma-sacti cluster domain-containing protein [Nonomuraea sediminis]